MLRWVARVSVVVTWWWNTLLWLYIQSPTPFCGILEGGIACISHICQHRTVTKMYHRQVVVTSYLTHRIVRKKWIFPSTWHVYLSIELGACPACRSTPDASPISTVTRSKWWIDKTCRSFHKILNRSTFFWNDVWFCDVIIDRVCSFGVQFFCCVCFCFVHFCCFSLSPFNNWKLC